MFLIGVTSPIVLKVLLKIHCWYKKHKYKKALAFGCIEHYCGTCNKDWLFEPIKNK